MTKDIEYWKRLKKFYETNYIGILPNANTEMHAEEIMDGGATVYEYGEDMFDPDNIGQWISDTSMSVSREEILEFFPNFYDYYDDEIASWFMYEDLNLFKKELKQGNDTYIKIAMELKWEEMLSEIPNVRDIFLF